MKKSGLHLSNLIPLLSVPAAILIPKIGIAFSPYVNWILGTLLFFSFLGLDTKKLIKSIKNPLEPIYMSIVILIIAPLVAMPIMASFFPDYQLGALLFLSAPSAVAAPAVASIYAGNVAFTAINTILSSLLSPFTTPALITFFGNTTVQPEFTKMMLQLATLIFIPFFLSLGFGHYQESATEKIKPYSKKISLFLVFMVFFAILSPQKEIFLSFLLNKTLWAAVLVVHVILFFFAKLMTINVESKQRRVSIEANLMFLNVGLALILAQTYFGPIEILFVVFCQILWATMVSLFRYIK